MRWQSWLPWACATRTASVACAPCWSPPPSAGRSRVPGGGTARSRMVWPMPAGGPLPASHRRPSRRRQSSILLARSCVATGWYSGACSNARRTGFHPGASFCAPIAASRAEERFAAGALSRASRASNSPCRRPSASCGRYGDRKPADELISVCGADPLNLLGILTPGPRLPAVTGNRLLYRDGLPIAALVGGEMQLLSDPDTVPVWQLRLALLGRRSTRHIADPEAVALARRSPNGTFASRAKVPAKVN